MEKQIIEQKSIMPHIIEVLHNHNLISESEKKQLKLKLLEGTIHIKAS